MSPKVEYYILMLPFYLNNKMATVRHNKPTKLGDSYATPEWLKKALDAEFRFELDPCPFDPAWSPERVLTGESIDGLALDWTGKRIYCNPPYSNILPWVKKAISTQCLTVFLVPVRSDTEWFFLLNEAGAEMRFMRKRIDFTNIAGKKVHPAESSVIAIVRRLA